MIALIQRVTNAQVNVDDQVIGKIEQGICALIGIEKNDTQANAERLLQRILSYRIFSDENEKMNLALSDIQGGLLLVPQFTLAANTKSGKRPSFSTAAPPALGQTLFSYFIDQAKIRYPYVQTGEFGANMQVSLCNDGPVTFWLTA